MFSPNHTASYAKTLEYLVKQLPVCYEVTNPNFRVDKNPPLDPILNQMNPFTHLQDPV